MFCLVEALSFLLVEVVFGKTFDLDLFKGGFVEGFNVLAEAESLRAESTACFFLRENYEDS